MNTRYLTPGMSDIAARAFMLPEPVRSRFEAACLRLLQTAEYAVRIEKACVQTGDDPRSGACVKCAEGCP